MTRPVASGAQCECDKGSAPCCLIGTMAPTILAEGAPVLAAVTDNAVGANIADFGTCKIDHKPCVPVTPGPWVPGHANILMLGGPPLLTAASILACTKGGKIKITNPGQGTIDAGGGGGDPLIDFFGDASLGSIDGGFGVDWDILEGKFGPYLHLDGSFGELKGGFNSPLGKTEGGLTLAKGSAKASLTDVGVSGQLGTAEFSHSTKVGFAKSKTSAEVYAAKGEAKLGAGGFEAHLSGPGVSASQEIGVGGVKATGSVGAELGLGVGARIEGGKFNGRLGPVSASFGVSVPKIPIPKIHVPDLTPW